MCFGSRKSHLLYFFLKLLTLYMSVFLSESWIASFSQQLTLDEEKKKTILYRKPDKLQGRAHVMQR